MQKQRNNSWQVAKLNLTTFEVCVLTSLFELTSALVLPLVTGDQSLKNGARIIHH